MGCDEEHDYQSPCPNNFVWEALEQCNQENDSDCCVQGKKNITINANGKNVVAMVVDECDSTKGFDKDHDYQPPCPNNIVDTSKARIHTGLREHQAVKKIHKQSAIETPTYESLEKSLEKE
ncbi:hypothetical protein RYX36_030099 [Vicia faba]